jgi:hypothetical protein
MHGKRTALRSAIVLGALILPFPVGALTLEGEWTNTTFGSTGPVTIEIDTGEQLTVSADFGGNVFGGFDPPPIGFTVPYNPSGSTPIELMGHPVFGNVTGSVLPGGAFNFTSTLPQGSFITSAVVNGTFDGQLLSANYTVNFVDGAPAAGTISATVPAPGGALLLAFGLVALAGVHRFGRRRP